MATLSEVKKHLRDDLSKTYGPAAIFSPQDDGNHGLLKAFRFWGPGKEPIPMGFSLKEKKEFERFEFIDCDPPLEGTTVESSFHSGAGFKATITKPIGKITSPSDDIEIVKLIKEHAGDFVQGHPSVRGEWANAGEDVNLIIGFEAAQIMGECDIHVSTNVCYYKNKGMGTFGATFYAVHLRKRMGLEMEVVGEPIYVNGLDIDRLEHKPLKEMFRRAFPPRPSYLRRTLEMFRKAFQSQRADGGEAFAPQKTLSKQDGN